MNLSDLFARWKFPLILSVLLAFLYVHLFENRAFVELDINVTQKTWFNIYWAGDGQGYSRWKRARVRVYPDKQHYRFFLTDLKKIQRLRIDPHKYQGDVVIKKLIISQNGFHPLLFVTKSNFSLLKPIFHIGRSNATHDGLKVRSTGTDPQLELPINLQNGNFHLSRLFARICSIFLTVFFFFVFTEGFRDEIHFIPVFLATILVLIVVMAGISRENVHPDEYVHLDAVRYYKTNWLPPAVDDPSIRHTYSVYGVSRLNNREVSYFFSGKLAQLIAPFKLPDYLSLRIFNILLFGGVLFYILKNQQARLMAAPLLISPQLWYLFSYCNSDAFALVVAFLVSCQLVLPHSMLNSYVEGKSGKSGLIQPVLLGMLCTLLFLLKKNYYFFICFIIGYLVWRFYFYIGREKRKQVLKRILIIVLIGTCLAGLTIAGDYAINGLDKSEKIARIREELADPLYKPSTPLEKKHTFLYRKARGVSLTKIIVIDRWFEKTFRSAFGMYGYFTVSAVDSYYNCVRWVGAGFLIFLTFGVLIRGGMPGNLLLLLGYGCSAALVGASLWHSWTADFQTQGRYLAPIVPMLCIVVYHSRSLLQVGILKLFLSALFLLSLYSYIFVGLLGIPKIS